MRKVRRLCPDLVSCSRASDVVREHVSIGVELYPDCGSLYRVCIDGECSAVEHLELSDFLEIVRGAKYAVH